MLLGPALVADKLRVHLRILDARNWIAYVLQGTVAVGLHLLDTVSVVLVSLIVSSVVLGFGHLKKQQTVETQSSHKANHDK